VLLLTKLSCYSPLTSRKGWNYVFQWAIVLPLELVVAGLTVNYWGADVNVGIWITVFLMVILLINVFGVLGYAEVEFCGAVLKLSTVSIFLIMGVIFVCGGGPKSGQYGEYWGARTWYSPGAFADGFPGLCAVFVTAAFSFSGTELVGLAAAESATPQQSLPSAVKQVFWRITLFYILGLFFVGLLVPWNDPRLLGSGGYLDVSTSPFVITAVNAGIPAFGDFVNAVILCSVISIGLSGVYGGSRTLTALAEQGYAPKIFAYVDKAGRPLWSTVFILAWAPLAYITLASTGVIVFDWLLALSGLAALFTWGSICLAHIRFRAAWKHNGHTLDEIPFQAVFGVYGSWVGLTLIILVLVAQVSLCQTRSSASQLTCRSSTPPSDQCRPRLSSSRISQPSSSSCFTLLAGSGSAKAGSSLLTLTLIPVDARLIGSTLTRRELCTSLGPSGASS
jgi:amino acid transporter